MISNHHDTKCRNSIFLLNVFKILKEYIEYTRFPFLQKYMHLLQKLELFFLFQVVSTCFVGTDMFDIPLKVTPYLILYTGKGYCMIFL